MLKLQAMKKSYTIQFEYNGQTITRSGMRNDSLKSDINLSDLAYISRFCY